MCRADARRTFEVGDQLTGFTFGSRKIKTLCARLYDKTDHVDHVGHVDHVDHVGHVGHVDHVGHVGHVEAMFGDG